MQAGNAPEATLAYAKALGILDRVALHTASFATRLPFENGHFALVTSSLAIREFLHKERKTVIMELARVTAPGGRIIILEPMGYAVGYEDTLRGVCNWGDVEVSMGSAEIVINFWPCQILVARKLNLKTAQRDGCWSLVRRGHTMGIIFQRNCSLAGSRMNGDDRRIVYLV